MMFNILLMLLIGATQSAETESLYRVKRWKGDTGDDLSSMFRGTAGVDYPNYKSIPVTGFKCSDYPYPDGLYADLEAQCQVYHVCHDGRKESFLCGKGTVFNQQILTCDYWYSTECDTAPNYYYLNEQIGDIPGSTSHQTKGQGYSSHQTSRLDVRNQGGTHQTTSSRVGQKRNQASQNNYKPLKIGQYQPGKLAGDAVQYEPEDTPEAGPDNPLIVPRGDVVPGQYNTQPIAGGSGQYNPQSIPGESGQYNPQFIPGDSGQYYQEASPGDSGQYYPQNIPGDSGQYIPENLPGGSGQYYEGGTSNTGGHQFKGSSFPSGPSESSGHGSTGQTRAGNRDTAGLSNTGSHSQSRPGGHNPIGQTRPSNNGPVRGIQISPPNQGVRQTIPSSHRPVGQTQIRQPNQGSVTQTRTSNYSPVGQTQLSAPNHGAVGQPQISPPNQDVRQTIPSSHRPVGPTQIRQPNQDPVTQTRTSNYSPVGQTQIGAPNHDAVGQPQISPPNHGPVRQIRPNHGPNGQTRPSSHSPVGPGTTGQTRHGGYIASSHAISGNGPTGYLSTGSHIPTVQRPDSHVPSGQHIQGNHNPTGQRPIGGSGNTQCQNGTPDVTGKCQTDGQEIYILAVWQGNSQTNTGADGEYNTDSKGNIYSNHYPKPPGSKLNKKENPIGIQHPQPQRNTYHTGSQVNSAPQPGVSHGSQSTSGITTLSQRQQPGPWSFPAGGMMMMGGPGDR